MTVNDPNSEANRLAKLQAQWVNNRATQNLSAIVPPVVATPIPTQTPVNNAPISPTSNINQLQHEINIQNRQNSVTPTPVPSLIGTQWTNENLPSQLNSTDQSTIDRMTLEWKFWNIPWSEPNVLNWQVDNIQKTSPKVQITNSTTPPVDFNAWLGREADISANLDKFKSQNMTPDQIKQASGYATADQNKKNQIDAFLGASTAPVLMDQKSIVNALISGQTIPVQKTQAYNNAVVQANEFKKFNGMTSTQLLDNLKQGQIGTEMQSLLSQNPNFAKAKAEQEKIQKTDSINRATQMASNVISGKTTPPVNDLANIEAKYSAPAWTDAQAYEQYVTQNQDVVTAWLQVKQLAKNIADVTTTYNQALKDLKSQYPDMPASALLTLMWSRTGETKSLLDSYINAQTTAKGDFDLAMKMAEGHYNAVSKDIANQQALDNEKKKLQIQADFNKQQSEQALNDPATQIKATLEEFSKLWVTATGWLPWKVQEAKDWIAKWGTLDWYVNQMRKDLMAKPEYVAQALKKANEWVSFQTIGDKVYKVKDGQLIDTGVSASKPEKWTFVKWEDGNWINTTTKEVINEKDMITQQESKKLNDYIANTPVWSKWGQCGSYANKNPVAVANWFHFGDSYQSKLDQTNSKEGAIGAFAVWNPGGVTKDNWHVGQIVWESNDGNSWIIRDSNYSNNPKDETVREHAVSKSVISSTGGAYAVPGLNKKSSNEGIVTTVLGSGKFTKDQATAIKNAISSWEDPLTVVKNQARWIMQWPVATEVEKLEQTKANMESLDSALKEFYKQWGDSSYLKGNYEKVINWFGELTDPKLVSVGIKIQKALQKYRNAVSGTAYGIQEGKDIASVFPWIDKWEVLNNTITQANLESMQSDIDSAYRGVLGSAYDTLKSQQKSTTPNKKEDFLSALKSIATSFQNSISGVKK